MDVRVSSYISLDSYLGLQKKILTSEGGAIRDLNGKLRELPRIVLENDNKVLLNNFPVSGVGAVSSIIGNVQTAYLQKTVNMLSNKVDNVLKNVNKTMFISCFGAVLTAANLTATVIGDAVIIKEIHKLETKLYNIDDKIGQVNGKLERVVATIRAENGAKYIKNYNNLLSIITELQLPNLTLQRIFDIERSALNEARGYLYELIDNFYNGLFDQVSPELLFQYIVTYYKAIWLYWICCKQVEYPNSKEELVKRENQILSKMKEPPMREKLYL